MNLRYPIVLFISPVIIVALYLLYRRIAKVKKIALLSLPFNQTKKAGSKIHKIISNLLFLILLVLLTILAARPGHLEVIQDEDQFREVVFVLDISGSMDLVLTNMIKQVKNMIKKSEATKFALVVFQDSTFTLSPMTSDKNVLIERLDTVQKRQLYLYYDQNAVGGGTNIFNGLSLGLLKFPENENAYKKRTKTIILLTDGVYNVGENPEKAIPYARKNKIAIYPVVPKFSDQIGDEYIDYQKNIARSTGGKYFVINNNGNNSKKVLTTINSLEKSEIKGNKVSRFVDNQEVYVAAFIIILPLYLFANRRLYV